MCPGRKGITLFLVSLIFSWYLQAHKDAFVSPISVSVEWEALQPSTVSYLFVCFLNESEKVRGAEAFWFVLPAITWNVLPIHHYEWGLLKRIILCKLLELKRIIWNAQLVWTGSFGNFRLENARWETMTLCRTGKRMMKRALFWRGVHNSFSVCITNILLLLWT